LGRKVHAKTLAKNGGNGEYYMKVGKDTINGDITTKNDAKYINHSCRPNCVARQRSINGKNRVFIFSTKKINKNTELTFDYHWTVEREEDRTRCRCSAGKYCRKFMEELVEK
jgi:SET domain-containing protein